MKFRTSVFLVVLLFTTAAFAASNPPHALKITRVIPDFAQQILLIEGVNFGSAPAVSLAAPGGAVVPLSPISNTDEAILVALPTTAPGTYLLIVVDGNGNTKQDTMAITLGAIGPVGPEGPMGPKGDKGD